MFPLRREVCSGLLALAFCLLCSTLANADDPIELARGDANNQPQQPQIAIDSRGSIHVVYGIGPLVQYRRSDDGGKRFSEPIDLAFAHAMSLGMRRGPRLAVSDQAICVSVIGGEEGKGRDGDVLARSSFDGGQSWSEPVRVNRVVGSAREGLHAMSGHPNGSMVCVWLDLATGKTEIMSSISADGGRTWKDGVTVYRSPDGSVCECCHPSVTYDEQGHLHVQWRNSLKGARDVYFTTSTDGGQTFRPASKWGTGTWPLNACPMDGGAIAVHQGKQVSVWRRDQSVFLATQGDATERLLGPGEQPWIAATDQGPYVVWLKRRNDTAFLWAPDLRAPRELASRASDPVIAAAPHGRGPVVAAWESRHGDSSTIQLQLVTFQK